MGAFELLRFPDAEQLAKVAASEWLNELQAIGARDKPFCIALSAGRIARVFLSAASALFRNQNLLRPSVHFFWGDERCVPPNDPESNFRLANEAFLSPLEVPAAQVHRIRGEDSPQKAVEQAETELRHWASTSNNGVPVLDLVFLGMGEDGHVASLFPGEPEQTVNNPDLFRSAIASKPPPNRITLGYPALAAARQIWVLASGAGKETALHASLSPDGHTPLARLLKLRSHSRVFTDLSLEKIERPALDESVYRWKCTCARNKGLQK
jgi:6-phosphogluconolactonase